MQYDNSFKREALLLSDELDVRKAVEQLGIQYYTLADWRFIRKHQGTSYFVGSGYKRKPVDEKDRRLQDLKPNYMKPSELMRYSRVPQFFSTAKQTVVDESVFNNNFGVPSMQMSLALIEQKIGIRELRRIMLKMGLSHELRRRSQGLTKATTEIQEKKS